MVKDTTYTLTWDTPLLKYFVDGDESGVGYEAVSENITIFLGGSDGEGQCGQELRFLFNQRPYASTGLRFLRRTLAPSFEPPDLTLRILPHYTACFIRNVVVYNMTLGAITNTGSSPVIFPNTLDTDLRWYMLIFSAENTAVWSWSSGWFDLLDHPLSRRTRTCLHMRW